MECNRTIFFIFPATSSTRGASSDSSAFANPGAHHFDVRLRRLLRFTMNPKRLSCPGGAAHNAFEGTQEVCCEFAVELDADVVTVTRSYVAELR